jgi:hypothetical protein
MWKEQLVRLKSVEYLFFPEKSDAEGVFNDEQVDMCVYGRNINAKCMSYAHTK